MAAQIIAFPQASIARRARRDFERFEEAVTAVSWEYPELPRDEWLAEILKVERIVKSFEERKAEERVSRMVELMEAREADRRFARMTDPSRSARPRRRTAKDCQNLPSD